MENKDSFVELYTKLYNENFKELEIQRKKEIFKEVKILIMILVGVLVISLILNLTSVSVIKFLIICLLIYVFIKWKTYSSKIRRVYGKNNINFNSTYKVMFKEKIITPILKNMFPSCEYIWHEGLDWNDYIKGRWNENDLYHSEDKLVIPVNIKECPKFGSALIISEVHSRKGTTANPIGKKETVQFDGLAGYVNLPCDVGFYIRISIQNIPVLIRDNKIIMDMLEFEKIFDVETDDRIKAMQFLTADVMTGLLDLVKISKVKIELYIKNDIMHIRFHTGDIFEPEIFGKSMQLNNLKRYCYIVSAIKNVTEHICNDINEKEF